MTDTGTEDDEAVVGEEDERWSRLELDVLGEVTKRLNLCLFIRFAAVCTAWRSIAIPLSFPAVARLPWLLSRQDQGFDLITFPDGRLTGFMLPRGFQWMSSSKGWIIASGGRSGKVILFNPLAAAETQIELPPIGTPLSKIVLSARPTEGDCIIVALPKYNFCSSLICKPGDHERWTIFPEKESFQDILFFNESLYALTNKSLLVYRFDGAEPSLLFSVPFCIDFRIVKYLTESCGKILIVSVHTKKTLKPITENKLGLDHDHTMVSYNLEPDLTIHESPENEGRAAIKVKTLGKRALFLSLMSEGISVEGVDSIPELDKITTESGILSGLPSMACSMKDASDRIRVKHLQSMPLDCWFMPYCKIEWRSQTIYLSS